MGSIDNKPLYALTIEEFTQLLDDRIQVAITNAEIGTSAPRTTGRLVYGLRGIQQLFGVSHKTAQAYKDGLIKEAVRQHGRKIVIDADYALELFNKRSTK